jgi:CBS domain-containing protein
MSDSDLLHATLYDIIWFLGKSNQELVHLSSQTTIEDVGKILKQKNILSVPVFDEEKNLIIGQIDTLEIMRFTALEFVGDNIMKDNFFTNIEYTKGTAGLLCKVPRCNKILIMDGGDTLRQAMIALSTVYHRMLVLTKVENSSAHVYRMLTQMDIVRYLNAQIVDRLGNNSQATIEDIGLLNTRVVSIFTCNKAVDGFQKMYDNNINAVPVLDENTGKIVANLSASDLRGITYENIASVKMPVLDFLDFMLGKRPRPITCSKSAKVEHVLSKITSENVHRVWITDQTDKVTGVVTLTDIINAVLILGSQQQK